MSRQETIAYQQPINPMMLHDAAAFGHMMGRAMHGAQAELAKIAEGRATTIDNVQINIRPYTQPFGPEIENIFIIDLRMTVTIAEQ